MAKFEIEIPDELIAQYEAAAARCGPFPELDQDGARQRRAEVFGELTIVADRLGTVLGGIPILRRVCTSAWARWDDQATRWAERAERRP